MLKQFIYTSNCINIPNREVLEDADLKSRKQWYELRTRGDLYC